MPIAILRNPVLRFITTLVILAWCAASAAADGKWPGNKPVTIVVAYGAGGPSDIIGRLVGKQLSELWGTTVIIENKAGASGHIAAQHVARSAPDGHTLLLIDTGSITSATHGMSELKYEPLKELGSVGVLGFTPHVLVVRKGLEASDIPQLLKLARNNPGKLSVATQWGLPQHLSAIKLATQEGLDWNYVFYKGSAQFLTDMIGGHVDLALTAYSGAANYAKGGQLKILAVAGEQRFSLAPDIPTVQETVPGYTSAGSWQVLMAPKGTPPELLETLYTSVRTAVNSPKIKSSLRDLGFDIADMTPRQLDARMAQESKMYADIFKAGGLGQ